MKKTTILFVTLLLSLSATAQLQKSNAYLKGKIKEQRRAERKIERLKRKCQKNEAKYKQKLSILESGNFSQEEIMKRKESLSRIEDRLESCRNQLAQIKNDN